MFLLGLVTLAFLFLYWTLLPARLRRPSFMAVSLLALTAYAPLSVAVLGLLTAITFLLLRRSQPSGPSPWPAATTTIVLCLAALAGHKLAHVPSEFLGRFLPAAFLRPAETGAALRLLGVSYAVFRLIHVAVDSARGRLQVQGLGRLLEYVLFPPSFLSGPIERYRDFETNVDTSRLPLDAALWGTRRILFGLLKKVFLVEPLLGAADRRLAALATASTFQAWEAVLAFSLFIYLDFSAYCDIALGLARLFGFRLSENFRWPYLAASITEFWRDWHITLSNWLRDYVYLPLSVRLTHVSALRRRPLLAASLSALVTMLACGIWHGTGVSFAVWGLGHGMLLAGHQAYRQRVLSRLSARQRRALAGSVPYRWACTAVTFSLVSVLWLLFRFEPPEAGRYTLKLLGLMRSGGSSSETLVEGDRHLLVQLGRVVRNEVAAQRPAPGEEAR